MKAAPGVTGCPAAELMTLAKTGTRALAGAVPGPPAAGETGYPRPLRHLLRPGMLVLAGRGFGAAAFLGAIAAAPAPFRARRRPTHSTPVTAIDIHSACGHQPAARHKQCLNTARGP